MQVSRGVLWGGWLTVALLLLWVFLIGPWLTGPGAAEVELPLQQELQSFVQQHPAAGLDIWLNQQAKALRNQGEQGGILLVQAEIGRDPLVVAVADDPDEDPDNSSGWPVPWPEVRDLLRTELPAEPTTVFDSLGELSYAHRVLPVHPQQGLYLLINRAEPAPPWFGWRGLLLGLALGLAGLLILIQRQ